jgi:hypothetical protein
MHINGSGASGHRITAVDYDAESAKGSRPGEDENGKLLRALITGINYSVSRPNKVQITANFKADEL